MMYHGSASIIKKRVLDLQVYNSGTPMPGSKTGPVC